MSTGNSFLRRPISPRRMRDASSSDGDGRARDGSTSRRFIVAKCLKDSHSHSIASLTFLPKRSKHFTTFRRHAFATHPSTATVLYARAMSFLEMFAEKLPTRTRSTCASFASTPNIATPTPMNATRHAAPIRASQPPRRSPSRAR